MADITDQLERTYQLIKSRGYGVHAGWVRNAIQEIVELREELRILKHESGIPKKGDPYPTREAAQPPDFSKEPFSHSEEKNDPIE